MFQQNLTEICSLVFFGTILQGIYANFWQQGQKASDKNCEKCFVIRIIYIKINTVALIKFLKNENLSPLLLTCTTLTVIALWQLCILHRMWAHLSSSSSWPHQPPSHHQQHYLCLPLTIMPLCQHHQSHLPSSTINPEIFNQGIPTNPNLRQMLSPNVLPGSQHRNVWMAALKLSFYVKTLPKRHSILSTLKCSSVGK